MRGLRAGARRPSLPSSSLLRRAPARRRPSPAPPAAPLLGLRRRRAPPPSARSKRAFDASLDPADQRAWLKRLTARPHHVGSPYGKENAEYLASLFRSFGFETRIEEFTVLFPVPKTRVLELVAPGSFTAVARGAAAGRGRDVRAGGRAAPDLQRLLDRRRRHGRGRLRELRRPEGLPRARGARHRREGEDRPRALRRLVARHQAEGRRRARRGRLPHLLRSEGRRLLPGRRLSEGRVPERSRGAARLGRRHAGLSRRSAHARRGRDDGREAPRPQGRADAHEDPRPADLVRRRAAVPPGARRSGRARSLARRAADHVPHRPRAREGAPQARVRLAHGAGAGRRSPSCRARSVPTSGSSAATTTTRG